MKKVMYNNSELSGSFGQENTPIGTILMYGGSTLPFGYMWCNGSGFRLQSNLPIPKENIINIEGVFIRLTDAGTPAYFISNCDCYVLQDNSLNVVQRISTFSGQYAVRVFIEYI